MEAKKNKSGESISHYQITEPIGNWVAREFDFISTETVENMYDLRSEQLIRLDTPSEQEILLHWPAHWRTMFHPRDDELADFIRSHPDMIAKFGFLVYDSKDLGLLLGMDESGYVFYAEVWERLRALITNN